MRPALCAMILTLCACGTPDAVYIVKCPALTEYSRAEMDKSAHELARLPPDAATLVFMSDYGTLRAKCRALVDGAL